MSSLTMIIPRQTESPAAVTASPLPRTGTTSAFGLANEFVQGRVGEKYFKAHYTPVDARATSSGLIKATYRYMYEPYVQDFVMTLFLDAAGKSLATSEVTIALLEPQEFVIDQARAVDLAIKNGAGQSTDAYRTSLVLNQRTRNRFAWRVINDTMLKNQAANAGRIYSIVADVQTGEPYLKEPLGVSESH